jgi:hypothetical protein
MTIASLIVVTVVTGFRSGWQFGAWQIGHMTATEYGMKAQDAARQMRAVDPSLKLIACGSSGPGMPTYLEWIAKSWSSATLLAENGRQLAQGSVDSHGRVRTAGRTKLCPIKRAWLPSGKEPQKA